MLRGVFTPEEYAEARRQLCMGHHDYCRVSTNTEVTLENKC